MNKRDTLKVLKNRYEKAKRDMNEEEVLHPFQTEVQALLDKKREEKQSCDNKRDTKYDIKIDAVLKKHKVHFYEDGKKIPASQSDKHSSYISARSGHCYTQRNFWVGDISLSNWTDSRSSTKKLAELYTSLEEEILLSDASSDAKAIIERLTAGITAILGGKK